MTYNQRILLRRLLPVAFWLLALGGTIALPLLIHANLSANYWLGFIPAAIMLIAIVIAKSIDRHESYVNRMFRITMWMGIASYWLPTILFLILVFWGYAIWKATASFKAFLAIIIALAMDAIYASIFIYLGWINNTWAHFFEPDLQWGWIPVAAIASAWLASTIARLLLRER